MIPGWFVGVIVLMIVVSVGTWLYRISVARSIAENAGLDPDQAARVAMISKDGVEAAYVASALAQRSAPRPVSPPPVAPAPVVPAPVAPAKTAEQRLLELQNLKDRGLISDEEFQAQRQRIVGSI
jgi:hypothetical protein